MSAEGEIQHLHYGKHGEINGVILTDGSIVRFSREVSGQFESVLEIGQSVSASGYGTKNQYGKAFEATALSPLGQANADKKELSKQQVPKPVLESFEKAYPNANEVEFEKEMFEGKDAYEVEYEENGKEYKIVYAPDGVILQKEKTIHVKALPKAVVQAISKAHPKAIIDEAEKIMKSDGTVTGYEAKLKTDGKELKLELDANGHILETKQD